MKRADIETINWLAKSKIIDTKLFGDIKGVRCYSVYLNHFSTQYNICKNVNGKWFVCVGLFDRKVLAKDFNTKKEAVEYLLNQYKEGKLNDGR